MVENVLEIRELRKDFTAPDGERTRVVDVPAFDLAAGEQAALAGPSGSGKTTFLHLIAGILRPDGGSVRLRGREVDALGEAERDRLRAREIGYVFQSFHLLQGYSALENVLLSMWLAGNTDLGRARALLERVGLGERLHHRPSELSIGQAQRVAVARALANEPSLVLADEPTGNLDRARADEALELLRTACTESGAALLVVSHDRAVLESFERCEELGG